MTQLTTILILLGFLYLVCLLFLIKFMATNAKPDISETNLIDEPKMHSV